MPSDLDAIEALVTAAEIAVDTYFVGPKALMYAGKTLQTPAMRELSSSGAAARAALARLRAAPDVPAATDDTAKLLAEHTDLMNKYGANSDEQLQFFKRHVGNTKFCDLTQTARHLKNAIGQAHRDWHTVSGAEVPCPKCEPVAAAPAEPSNEAEKWTDGPLPSNQYLEIANAACHRARGKWLEILPFPRRCPRRSESCSVSGDSRASKGVGDVRVGTIAYTTEQGIGFLAKWFRDAGVVTDAMVFRHGSRPSHPEWHPGAVELVQRPFDGPDVEAFCKRIDVLLQFETPFDWQFIPFCQQRGVKVIIVPMHEWWPKHPTAMPNAFICPSLLDQQYFPGSAFLEIPVPPDVTWTRRTRARRFLHNAGNLGWHGHKGTLEILKALPLIKSPIELTVRAQDKAGVRKVLQQASIEPEKSGTHTWPDGRELSFAKVGNVELCFEFGDVSRGHLFPLDYDVFLMAEKYNGLSIPLREAWASGMMVMTSDRFPMNEWLPKPPLIQVKEYFENVVGGAYLPYQQAVIDHATIAAHIDAWYDRDVTEFSDAGREWAERTSWANLRQPWLDEIAKVLE